MKFVNLSNRNMVGDGDLPTEIADRLEKLIDKLPRWLRWVIGGLLKQIRDIIDELRGRVA